MSKIINRLPIRIITTYQCKRDKDGKIMRGPNGEPLRQWYTIKDFTGNAYRNKI